MQPLQHEPLLGEEHSPSKPSSPNEQCNHELVLAPSPSQTGSPHNTTEAKTPYLNLIANSSIHKKKITHRSCSAPPVLFPDAGVNFYEPQPRPAQKSSPLIVGASFLGVFFYIAVGLLVFMTSGSFKGTTTFKPVDAVYFTVVTLSTTGYGDITPDSTFTKIFTCGFILVGFGLIGFLLSGLVEYICDTQEAFLLNMMDENRNKRMLMTYMVDEQKGRIRIRTKVCLALAVVVGCIAIGTVTGHFVEGMDWEDSFYLSVTSVTTVGYGDYSFKTVIGRCFAIVWLLISTLAVAKAFVYLTDYSMHKRKRKMEKWILHNKITLSD